MWSAGAIALTLCAAASLSGTLAARRSVQQFEARQAALAVPATPPDQSLWSAERVRAWRASLAADASTPLAVLRIPRVELEVPVLAGTDDWTLNRAVGHIEGTAQPGHPGNAGIAGHRDSFFRVLKDVRLGDLVELETLTHRGTYRVERTWVVGPDDLSVLESTSIPSVTLVTCFPFYFVGSAPQRFIVRAVLAEARPGGSARGQE
jgi:sortase A